MCVCVCVRVCVCARELYVLLQRFYDISRYAKIILGLVNPDHICIF